MLLRTGKAFIVRVKEHEIEFYIRKKGASICVSIDAEKYKVLRENDELKRIEILDLIAKENGDVSDN
jgi:hypothetical protein